MIRLLVLASLSFSQAALADPPAPSEAELVRARAHFEAGRALYTLGRYEEALPEFVAGYQLFPRPEFLLDIAHCHRRLGHSDLARTMYQQFLVEARPGDPRILEVKRLLSELPASAPPVTSPPVTSVQPPAQPSPAAVVASPPPRRASFWRRNWWIVPVAGVVVAGVAVGIYFGTRSPPSIDCGSAGLGCVDARGP